MQQQLNFLLSAIHQLFSWFGSASYTQSECIQVILASVTLVLAVSSFVLMWKQWRLMNKLGTVTIKQGTIAQQQLAIAQAQHELLKAQMAKEATVLLAARLLPSAQWLEFDAMNSGQRAARDFFVHVCLPAALKVDSWQFERGSDMKTFVGEACLLPDQSEGQFFNIPIQVPVFSGETIKIGRLRVNHRARGVHEVLWRTCTEDGRYPGGEKYERAQVTI